MPLRDEDIKYTVLLGQLGQNQQIHQNGINFCCCGCCCGEVFLRSAATFSRLSSPAQTLPHNRYNLTEGVYGGHAWCHLERMKTFNATTEHNANWVANAGSASSTKTRQTAVMAVLACYRPEFQLLVIFLSPQFHTTDLLHMTQVDSQDLRSQSGRYKIRYIGSFSVCDSCSNA